VSQRLTVAAAVATAAASLSLYPLVSGWLWFWEGAGAVAVIALAGALTRLRVVPWVFSAAAGLAALLLYLNVLFASAQSLGRLIPTATSLGHLWRLGRFGLDETARFAPPAPAGHAILLLTVAGIGAVAVATDLLAVRLHRPAVAGLPLLVLFCIPLTTSLHQGVFGAMTVFGLGMAGYLGMLAVDARDRLRLWGRLVTVWHRGQDPAVAQRGTPNTRELAAAGRRVGVAAVVIALFIPLLVPGLRDHKLFSGGGGGSEELVTLPDPLVQMNRELQRKNPAHVLTYRTTDPDPEYLQVYVLGNLTSNTWTLVPAAGQLVHDGKLPATPGLSRRGTLTSPESTRITLSKGLTTGAGKASFLPLPYPARTVRVDGDWRTDPRTLTMFSGQDLAGLSYTVTSREVSPSPRQLQQSGVVPNSIDNNYLSVPQAFLSLSKLAQRITQGQATLYGEAVALQRWFTDPGRFTYSLNVSEPNTAKALDNFLTKDRRGYCQQFAFAMAVLARLLDIPSRVAVGYTRGSLIGNDRWNVRTSDAHAWPELYFQGAGWLRFEPTPAGSDGQATAIQPTYTLPPQITTPGGTAPVPAPAATVPAAHAKSGDSGALAKLGHLSARGALGGAGASRSGPIWLIIVAVIAVLLITPRLARSLTRRRRWSRARDDRQRAQVAWLELLDNLTDHQVAWSASESPRALGTRLGGTLRLSPGATAALARVVHATERARYARDPADSATLRADTDLVRREVAAGSRRIVRWRARLLPPSSLRPARAAEQHALDVFSWMDLAAHRTGALTRRGSRAA
jgi:transglutaminase-like putative cysteine protease